MKVAALDLGSNTFLCLIAEVENQRIQKIYSDEVEMVRLGQGLNSSKKFHPEALARANRCLSKFSQTILKHKPEKILAMATSAARDAENKEELFQIGKKYNIPIEIIPGEKEAQITYRGALSSFDLKKNKDKNYFVVDIGGGSTEFIYGVGPKLVAGESYNIGCVRLTEKFIFNQPTPKDQIENALKFIEKEMTKAQQIISQETVLDEIIAVAGTPTTLVAAELGKFDPQQIDGYQLTKKKLEEWLIRLASATFAQKLSFGIPEGRADVILIGVLILLETLKKFNKDFLTVSTRGVRYGIALEMDFRYNHPSALG